MTTQTHPHTLRNLLIFTFVTVTAGWLGLWLDRQMGLTPGQQGLGTLLWLVAPSYMVNSKCSRSLSGLRYSFTP